MAVIQSFGELQALTELRPPYYTISTTQRSVPLYGESRSYAQIYATQPNIRICVDFLARNIAQLGLHWFRRVSDVDRVRLVDHDCARWLEKPNPTTSRYRLIESLLGDLGVYFNAFWLKIRYRDADGADQIGLVRLPPEEMAVEGGLLPQRFIWTYLGEQQPLALSDVIYFNGYTATNALMGLSPMETLRQVLAEEQAASEHRAAYWQNASRIDGIIERPATAPRWQTDQKKEFREQWQSRFAGGAGAGLIAVLEDGMTFKAASFSPKDSEYLGARKLSREECAAAYHIPLPMVGILEHATFSNIKEQHKQLYQDTLGPWLEMIQQELERQLLVESNDTTNVYAEFNIADKMKGSFEEQTAALAVAVRRAFMTANEARARLNLPRLDDPTADQLAAQQGGPADASANPDGTAALPQDTTGAIAAVITATQERQRARLDKIPVADRPAAFHRHRERYTRELADDLTPLMDSRETAWQLALTTNAAMLASLEADALPTH